MRRIFIVALISLVGTPVYGQSECAAALTETGRNELLSISQIDREAYHYKKVCESSGTDVGAEFEKAKVVLGFSFSTRQEYCSAEQSRLANHQFDFLRTSTVVEKALDSWLKCIDINRRGIKFTPQVERTRLVLTLERSARATGRIDGILPTAGTTCKAPIRQRTTVLGETVNFTLSTRDAWTIVCDRASRASAVTPDATVFPETNVTLLTSEGGFSITLPEEPLGAERWATDIDARLDRIDARAAANEQAVVNVAGQIPNGIELFDCQWSGWMQKGINDPFSCPAGKFLTAYQYGSLTNPQFRSWEMQVHCCNARPKRQ